jgi:hypothetical protein
MAIVLAAVLKTGDGRLGAEQPARRVSLPYSVMVALEARSPFVADGRMSIADLVFSATFKEVVFFYDRDQGPGFMGDHNGKLFLTRHEFNDVEGGCDRHKPWVKKAWPLEFAASLVNGWIEREDEPAASDDGIPLVPLVPGTVKIGFYARFGLLDLEWFSELGSCVLSNMLYEFEAPWAPLLDGKPLTLKFPYQGDYAEDTGTWWIEFVPVRK